MRKNTHRENMGSKMGTSENQNSHHQTVGSNRVQSNKGERGNLTMQATHREIWLRTTVSILASIALVACGGGGDTGGGDDDGNGNGGLDAGVTLDAGNGGGDDSSVETDGGSTPDGGTQTDGSMGDGGSPDGGDSDGGTCPDSDSDTVCDSSDVCPGHDDLMDDDSDGVPNGCDLCAANDDNDDADSDGVPDGCDICSAGDDNDDADSDTVPDACDVCAGSDDMVDTDMDTVPDGCDICAGSNDTNDADSDGVPNGCDICPGSDDNGTDTDSDGVPDACDVCATGDDTLDADSDGVPDACDVCAGHDDTLDDDMDMIPNGCDTCPMGSADADMDGVPDACDICMGHDDAVDTDSDGVPDGCDVCAGGDDNVDTDSDGVADHCDICAGGNDTEDADSDGVPDACDLCAGSDDSSDADSDGVPDGCDICAGGDDNVDTDSDSVPDFCDVCAGGDDNVDSDSDGTADFCDLCPGVANQNNSLDTDGDGTPDECDACGANIALGPVAYWRFGETSASDAAVDATGNGHDGTYKDSPVLNTAGVKNAADNDTGIFFDETNLQRMVIPSFTGFPSSGKDVSVFFWLRQDSNPDNHGMVFKYSTAASGGRLNEFRFYTRQDSSTGFNYAYVTIGGSTETFGPGVSDLSDNQWHHVGVTWQQATGTLRYYVDGVNERISNLRAGYTVDPNGQFVIGQDARNLDDVDSGDYYTGNEFRGRLDEFGIYDKVLSGTEITGLYNQFEATSCNVSCSTIGGSFNCPGTTCNAIKTAHSTSADGEYWIDPDGSAGYAPYRAYCDMTFDEAGDDTGAGGWTLLMSTSGNPGTGPNTCDQLEEGPILPGTHATLQNTDNTNDHNEWKLWQALVADGVSAQVHIRTAGAAATESVTSKAQYDDAVFAGWRQPTIRVLNCTHATNCDTPYDSNQVLTHFAGPKASISALYQSGSINYDHPDVWNANNSTDSLELYDNNSAWGSSSADVAMEVYVK